MLKEVYVIDSGVPIFHYIENKSQNITDVVLISGFLSAMQSFSKETRESMIKSYSSDNEKVLFDELDDKHLQLVCIFDLSTTDELAKSQLNQVRKEIERSKLLNFANIDIDISPIGVKLRQKIEKIINLTTSQKYIVRQGEQTFDENSFITLLMIYNLKSKRSLLRLARSNYLLGSKFSKQFKLLDETLMSNLPLLNWGNDYDAIIFDSDEFHCSLFKLLDKLYLGYSEDLNARHEIFNIPLSLNSLNTFDEYKEDFVSLNHFGKWKLDANLNLQIITGETPSWKGERSISKILNSLFDFLNQLKNQNFAAIDIYIKEPDFVQINITKQFTTNEFEINIFNNQTQY